MDGPTDGFLVGTCTAMCPTRELRLREKENLLHTFEMRTGTERDRLPRGDPDKAIKCYSRSAAGHKVDPSDLRPFPVLLRTIRYLYHEIFPRHKERPVTVYNFMFDRLRSVRQDLVIQNLNARETITILEPIARFHIYFGYILTEESDTNFDAYINNTHLQECLKRLLVCYDEYDREEESDVVQSVKTLTLTSDKLKNRADIEGAYLLFNLSNFDALTRGSRLVEAILNHKLLQLSFAWYLRNFVKVFKYMRELPPLLLCAVSGSIPEIRKYSLEAFSHGFSCSNTSYPADHLMHMLLYENHSDFMDDCNHFNVKVSEDGKVNFLKKNFNSSVKVKKLRRLGWIDRRLDCDLVQLLCYGNG